MSHETGYMYESNRTKHILSMFYFIIYDMRVEESIVAAIFFFLEEKKKNLHRVIIRIL